MMARDGVPSRGQADSTVRRGRDPEEIRGALADAVTPVRKRFPKARWGRSKNQHVTVKFLGSTYPRLVDWATATVGESRRATRHSPLGGGPWRVPDARRAGSCGRASTTRARRSGASRPIWTSAVEGVHAGEAGVHAAPDGRAVRTTGGGRSGRDRVRERRVRDRPDRAVPKPPSPPRSRVRADRDLPARFRA